MQRYFYICTRVKYKITFDIHQINLYYNRKTNN